MKRISEQTIKNNKFPWESGACRKVGDLLIGLQSLEGRELLSSNYKEHSPLSQIIGYKYREFPIAAIRSK